MKYIFIGIFIIGLAFVADKSVPSYDDHFEYIGQNVFNKTSSKNIFELGANIIGTGAKLAQNTGCFTRTIAQLNLYSVCQYDDGRSRIRTIGMFSKVFVINQK